MARLAVTEARWLQTGETTAHRLSCARPIAPITVCLPSTAAVGAQACPEKIAAKPARTGMARLLLRLIAKHREATWSGTGVRWSSTIASSRCPVS
jgi:hypothetical protein